MMQHWVAVREYTSQFYATAGGTIQQAPCLSGKITAYILYSITDALLDTGQFTH